MMNNNGVCKSSFKKIKFIGKGAFGRVYMV